MTLRQVHVEEDFAGVFIDQLLDDRQRLAGLGLCFRQLACLQEELGQTVVAESQLLPKVGDLGVLVD